MNVHSRLKKLEDELLGKKQLCAVFVINHYTCEVEREKAENRLIEGYRSMGQPEITKCLFLTDFGGTNKERYLYAC